MNKIDILRSIKGTINDNQYIDICDNNINKLVKELNGSEISMPFFESPKELTSLEDIVQYFFMINTINFKFWNDDKTKYTLDDQVGCQAMFYGFDNNLWLLDTNNLLALDQRKMFNIFGNIPMSIERLLLLKENAHILNDKYDGKAINILEEANYEMSKILDILFKLDPWHDAYSNHIFMKRAQLFLAMVHGNLQDKSMLKGIEDLTLYADYQIPKALESVGILEYNEYLSKKINNRQDIESGSTLELELRSFSIYVGEILSQKLNYPTPYLDYTLWKIGRNSNKNYHYTKSIWY